MAPKAKIRTPKLSAEQRIAIVEKVDNYVEQHKVTIDKACRALGIAKSKYFSNRLRIQGYTSRGAKMRLAHGATPHPKAGSMKASSDQAKVEHNGSDIAGITQEFPLAIIPDKPSKKAPQPKPINGSSDDAMTARQLLQVADRLSQVLAVAASLLVKRP